MLPVSAIKKMKKDTKYPENFIIKMKCLSRQREREREREREK